MNRILVVTSLFLVACLRPADERSDHDALVGVAEGPGIELEVRDGQAAVRELRPDGVVLWAQAPVFTVSLQLEANRSFRVEVLNCMPGAQTTLADGVHDAAERPRPTHCIFDLALPAGAHELVIAPPDWQEEVTYRFADMGDIQTAMDSVHEVFAAISATPDLRFVMSTGDVVENGVSEEYELFQEQIKSLNIPFFSTVGNHELTQDIQIWHRLFGRYSVHFRFKGVDFSYVDSGNASLDPKLYDRLGDWLDDGSDRIHIFGTHYPPLDPVGARNAGFRSRNEASKLLVELFEGNVDLTIYGHVHSYYKFENAGIPAYISGGGGALPERFDGIDRHFLVIEVAPELNKVNAVDVVRVDN